MKPENGRPKDLISRLEKERRCYELLDSLGISYLRVDHKPAMTMEDCLEADRVLDTRICKNLLLTNRQQTSFYLLLLKGDKTFSTKVFSSLIGSSRLSFAPPSCLEELLDITPGSLSVLGLMNDKEGRVTLYADADVISEERFGCHPCINTSTLSLKTKDLCDVLLPAMGHELHIVNLPATVE